MSLWGAWTMKGKPQRLEEAEFDRALAAVEWEIADDRATKTGKPSDKVTAETDDQRLIAADLKIKKIAAEK